MRPERECGEGTARSPQHSRLCGLKLPQTAVNFTHFAETVRARCHELLPGSMGLAVTEAGLCGTRSRSPVWIGRGV
jgi:hypothetical protein